MSPTIEKDIVPLTSNWYYLKLVILLTIFFGWFIYTFNLLKNIQTTIYFPQIELISFFNNQKTKVLKEFITKCAPFLLKIGEHFNIDD
jgi:hypothetical protein